VDTAGFDGRLARNFHFFSWIPNMSWFENRSSNQVEIIRA
jgi:hypothetical protein